MTYVQTLNQHQNNVISLLQLDNKVFVSSDKSFSLNVWEFENIQKEEEKNKLLLYFYIYFIFLILKNKI